MAIPLVACVAPNTKRWFWALILLSSTGWLSACTAPEPPAQTIIRPVVTIVPAGGIYRQWPEPITLSTDTGVPLYYRWDNGADSRYSNPLSVPAGTATQRVLQVWTETTGNPVSNQRETYILAPDGPELKLLGIDQTVLGKTDTTLVRWRTTLPTGTDATYDMTATAHGWGTGKTLAHGPLPAGHGEQQHSIASTALYPGRNRLWLRVKTADGRIAATSQWLTVHATATRTRAWPPGGTFGEAQTVSLLTERAATVYYTTDGTLPTRQSTTYTAPLSIAHTTTLRFFSLDSHHNEEPPQQTTYRIDPQANTITFRAPVHPSIGSDTPLRFSWSSKRSGHYEIRLEHQHEAWKRVIHQSMMQPEQEVQTTIERNFLSPGAWVVTLIARPDSGPAAEASFPIQVHYADHLRDTRYLNANTTTANWDTAQQQIRLTQGPRVLSTYPIRTRGRRVTLRKPYAFLAGSKGGLHIIDTSDPAHPQPTGRFNPHGKAVALAKYHSYIYMAAAGSGLIIFDVSQPDRPQPVGLMPISGPVADITIVGAYAYVGTKTGRLSIYDLAEPLAPKRLGQLNVGGRVVDVVVDAGIAYIAALAQGLIIVDVERPKEPRLLHRWPTANAATGVAVHGKHVIIATGNLEVLDISRPESPKRVMYHHTHSSYGVGVYPPYAISASGTDGIQLMKIAERSPIVSRASTHYAARVQIHGDRLFVADTRGGLRLMDVSDPSQPQVMSTVHHIGTIVDVVVDGHLAYLANDEPKGGLVIVDVSHPDKPRVIGWYHSEMTTDVAVWDNWALVSDATGLVQLLDISRVDQPQLRDTLAITGNPQSLETHPPYAYVASDAGGLHVVEITSDGELEFRTTVPIPGRAFDISRVDNTAFVAAVDGGIQSLDVSHPGQPTLGSVYHHPDGNGDHIIRLSTTPTHVFAIDNKRGIQVLSRSGTDTLTLQQSLNIPTASPWGLTTMGPYLFVTTLLNSMYAFEVTSNSQLQQLSVSPYGGADVVADDNLLYIAVRGRSRVPGGLQLVEAFSAVSETTRQAMQSRGITALPGLKPGSHRIHRAYTVHTPGVVESIAVSIPEIPIASARLSVQDVWGLTGQIDYALSNDGGSTWHPVQAGAWFHFPAPGHDLRWRATLQTTDIVQSPHIESVRIEASTNPQAPR